MLIHTYIHTAIVLVVHSVLVLRVGDLYTHNYYCIVLVHFAFRSKTVAETYAAGRERSSTAEAADARMTASDYSTAAVSYVVSVSGRPHPDTTDCQLEYQVQSIAFCINAAHQPTQLQQKYN